MRIDDLIGLILLFWWSALFYIGSLGYLYYPEAFRLRMIEILGKGGPLDNFNARFFNPAHMAIQKVSAVIGLMMTIFMLIVLGVARIHIDMPAAQLITILLSSFIIEMAAILWTMAFKRKFRLDIYKEGGFRAYYAFIAAGPPMIYYKIMFGIYAFLYPLALIKILMT